MHTPNLESPRGSVLLAAVLIAGCASAPPPPERKPEPYEPQKAAIGIEVSLQAPAGGLRNPAEVVYFVAVDGSGVPGTHLITSNFDKDGRAYLLNVRPGTYVAVAAQFPSRGGTSTLMPFTMKQYTTYFSKELAGIAKITAREGELAFMGSYLVDQSTPFFAFPDETQVRYRGLIMTYPIQGTLVHYYGALLERKGDEAARSEFMRKAGEDLNESSWAARIR